LPLLRNPLSRDWDPKAYALSPQADRYCIGEVILTSVVAMPGLEVPGVVGQGHVVTRPRPRHAREIQIELGVVAKPKRALVRNAHLTRLAETTDLRAAAQAGIACRSCRIRHKALALGAQ
jgi:hypothetical protein